MKYLKLFENFTDGDNKYPSSITVKPTAEFDLTRISEIYKIVTPEEIEKFETDLKVLFDEYLSDRDEDSNLQHKFDLWKKRHISKFTRRPSKKFNDEIEYDELSDDKKEECETLRKTNVEMIGKLFEKLISNYENIKDRIQDPRKVTGMLEKIEKIIDVLYFQYVIYFKHIMYPDKHE